jgi:hypothetical protein
MKREIIEMSRRFRALFESVNELENDLALLVEKQSRQLDSMEQAQRFDPGMAEFQGKMVRALEKSLSNIEQTQSLIDESLELYEDVLETR